jgi:peptidoglycan/LPS O-acetylase OafA/YrhL
MSVSRLACPHGCYFLPLKNRSNFGVVPSSGRRLPGIEGLRAAAALSVLVYHSWALSSPSHRPVDLGPFASTVPDLAFGVTLFFTLSGFLLYRPFARSILQLRSAPSITGYLRNRALRILPAYWVILLISSIAFETVLVRHGTQLRPGSLSGVGLLRAGTFTQNYSPAILGSGIGPAWSLAVEAVFYLLLPVLAVGALALARRGPLRRWPRAAALIPPTVLLVVGLSGKLADARLIPGAHNQWGNTWHSVVELSFWGQADLFAFGMGLAVLYVAVEEGIFALPRGYRLLAWATAICGYVLVRELSPPDAQLSYSPANTMMAFVCSLLLGLVVLQTAERRAPTLLLRVLETRPVIWIGLVSYSVFLWHGPIVRWLAGHHLVLAGRFGFAANTLFLLALTLAFSAVTYRFVEEPALRLKARKRPAEPIPPAQLSAAP